MSVEIFAHFCCRNHVSFQFNTLLSWATTYSMFEWTTEGQKDSYPKAAPQVFALPSSLSWVSFGGILNGKKKNKKQTSAKIAKHDFATSITFIRKFLVLKWKGKIVSKSYLFLSGGRPIVYQLSRALLVHGEWDDGVRLKKQSFILSSDRPRTPSKTLVFQNWF